MGFPVVKPLLTRNGHRILFVDFTLTLLASTKPPACSLGHLSTPAPLWGNMLPLHSKTQSPAGCFRTRSGGGERKLSVRALPLAESADSVVRTCRNILSASPASGSGSTRSQLHMVAESSTSVHQAEREPATEDSLLCTELPDSLLQQSLYSSLAGWWGDLSSAGHWLTDSEQLQPSSLLTLPIQVNKPPTQQLHKQVTKPGKDPKQRGDFYANVGEAIRVLRAEIPLLFQKDLTYDIYRDDITFRDPRNTFQGKKDYKTIFWSLRFHGRLFFRLLYVDVLRIWESPENVKDAGTVLKMRWSVHGIPRVPWDAEGIFDGISTFKLDSNGKIYEHAVNNVILKDPPKQGNPFLAGLNLIPLPQAQQQPCPGAWFRADCVATKKAKEQIASQKIGCKEKQVAIESISLAEEF